MVMAMRVAGNEENMGGKAIAMATRVIGKRTATATKRAMVMAIREAGKVCVCSGLLLQLGCCNA